MEFVSEENMTILDLDGAIGHPRFTASFERICATRNGSHRRLSIKREPTIGRVRCCSYIASRDRPGLERVVGALLWTLS